MVEGKNRLKPKGPKNRISRFSRTNLPSPKCLTKTISLLKMKYYIGCKSRAKLSISLFLIVK